MIMLMANDQPHQKSVQWQSNVEKWHKWTLAVAMSGLHVTNYRLSKIYTSDKKSTLLKSLQ